MKKFEIKINGESAAFCQGEDTPPREHFIQYLDAMGIEFDAKRDTLEILDYSGDAPGTAAPLTFPVNKYSDMYTADMALSIHVNNLIARFGAEKVYSFLGEVHGLKKTTAA